MARNNSRGQKPLRGETVRGEPYTVGERTLTPVARITSYGRARASIGSRRLEGWTGGFVRVTPLAVLEETAAGERRIAINDATRTALRRLLAMAVVTTLLLTTIRCCARRWRNPR